MAIVRAIIKRKECSRCHAKKRVTDFNLKYDKRSPGQRRTFCKSCDHKRPAQSGRRKGSKATIRKAKRKLQAIEYLGGKCMGENCPLSPGFVIPPNCFEFHHRDPGQKEFVISHYMRYRWSRLVKELDKCDLLCCICHRLLHTGIELGSAPSLYYRAGKTTLNKESLESNA